MNQMIPILICMPKGCDGPMPLLEKWVGFKEIGEFTDIIIKDGPLKGTDG